MSPWNEHVLDVMMRDRENLVRQLDAAAREPLSESDLDRRLRLAYVARRQREIASLDNLRTYGGSEAF